ISERLQPHMPKPRTGRRTGFRVFMLLRLGGAAEVWAAEVHPARSAVGHCTHLRYHGVTGWLRPRDQGRRRRTAAAVPSAAKQERQPGAGVVTATSSQPPLYIWIPAVPLAPRLSVKV